jgi:hypothetical protein
VLDRLLETERQVPAWPPLTALLRPGECPGGTPTITVDIDHELAQLQV